MELWLAMTNSADGHVRRIKVFNALVSDALAHPLPTSVQTQEIVDVITFFQSTPPPWRPILGLHAYAQKLPVCRGSLRGCVPRLHYKRVLRRAYRFGITRACSCLVLMRLVVADTAEVSNVVPARLQYATGDEQKLFETSLDLEPREHRKKSSVTLSPADIPPFSADAKQPMGAALSAPAGSLGYGRTGAAGGSAKCSCLNA
jgi:hypothetical protein